MVTDGNGCIDSTSIIISEPIALTSPVSQIPVTCTGGCDGTATVSPIGGTAPYTYSWNDPATQTNSIATGLCTGTYIAQVEDGNGCVSSSTIIVTEPLLLSSSISAVGVDCNGDCDGTADITVTNGTTPYTYLWSDGQTAPLAINLCAGTFYVTVTDNNGCTLIDSALITQPLALANLFSSTDVLCNGDLTGIATAGISGGTTAYTYQWDDINLQTTASATGLIANTYTVLVTDANGCTLSDVIVITEPVAITLVVDTTGANCGLDDGSACVTVSSGVAPFTYAWDDPGTQTTACATGLFSGIYNLMVTDNSGCTATELAVVNDLGAPTLVISAFADASCNNGCDGFATVLITNGLPPYIYTWDDPNLQTTASAGGLCAGTYVVSIIDSNGCTGSISQIIGEPSAVNVTISAQTDATCNSDCDGTATGLASGGTGAYTYNWNDPGTQTTQVATGLCAGSYGLTVIDNNGCTATTSVVILEPLVITLTTSSVDAHCSLNDGSATVVATGGNGLYQFGWDDLGTQNTATAIGIDSGTYCVLVTDILGCTATACVTVNDLPAGTLTISTTVNVSCNGGNDGSATVSMAGGTLPFTYQWDDVNTQTTITATGLIQGTYNAAVTDANGCIVNDIAVITEPPLLVVTTTADSVSCNGLCDGTATAIAGGGTTPYTYLWDDPLGQNTPIATGLCANTYSVTITDIKGCTVITSQNIDAPLSMTLSEIHSNANCGQPDGVVTITVTGGTPTYNYLWSNTATTASINNVIAGTYTVTVTDLNGCSESLSVTIADLAGPTATIIASDSVSCYGGGDGMATVSVTGGTLPYNYTWDDPLGQSAPIAANLPANTWTVTIKDSNNCIATAVVIISQPDSIIYSTNFTDPVCFGYCDGTVGVTVAGGITPYTYLWSDPGTQTNATAVGLCNGVYSVAITDANSCNQFATIIIVDPPPITATGSATDVTCFGDCDGTATAFPINGNLPFTYAWDDTFTQATQTASNLCAGTYNVTLTDNRGCFTTTSAIVGTPPLLTTAITASGNVSCNGFSDGYAQSTVSGGVAPYSYLWSDNQTGAQAINLVAGMYGLTVTDTNGCMATTSVTISEPQGMGSTTSQNNVSCFGACDGDATVSVGGGTPPYVYLWNDPSFQTTPTANGLCNGPFGVTITDNNGCIETASVILSQPQQLGLFETITASTCGFANGGACVNVIGGFAPFVIVWDDPLTTNGACITNVVAGIYNPIVFDGNGCFFTMPVAINDVTGPVIDSISNTNVTCNGDSNGTATVAATGVTPPLTYVWKNGGDTIASGVGVTTIFNLWGGVFSVTVIDGNGCITAATVLINEPVLLNSAIISSNNASCSGTCDGSATVFAGGGTTPYNYFWPVTGGILATENALCAGLHNVIITDANSCSTSQSITITEPLPLVIFDSVIDVSCNGGNDGAIYITVTGGTPFYAYGWQPLGTGNSNIVTNLTEQSYTVTVQDLKYCIESSTIAVNEPTPLIASGLGFPSTCGGYNGTAIVTPTGGTPPYTYLWDDPLSTTNDTVTDLKARDPYYVLITDSNGCTFTYQVTVGDVPGPVIDSIVTIDLLCHNDGTGSATAYINEGQSPFTYLWTPGSQSTLTATGLDAGAYLFTVTDFNNCFDNKNVELFEPDSLEIFVSNDVTLCIGQDIDIFATPGGGTFPPYTYDWDNGLGNMQLHNVNPTTTTIYTIVITDANGCVSEQASITVTVRPPIMPTPLGDTICDGYDATIGVAPVTGGVPPYNYSWSNLSTDPVQTISGITSNTTFYATISDSGNCSPDTVVQIDVIVNPIPDASFTGSGDGCEPYVFVGLPANAGTVPIMTWIWDFGDGSPVSNDADSTSHVYTTAGLYNVTLVVISVEGCFDTVIAQGIASVYGAPVAGFTINQNGVPLIPKETSILTPEVDFVNTASSNVDSTVWDFGDPNAGINNWSNATNPSHTYSDTGTYIITQTVYTGDGCDSITSDTLHIYGQYILFAPSAFSPNGDGKNDYFFPKGYGVDGEEFELFIFDRWGDRVATVEGVWSDDISIGWDGHANDGGKVAQIDVYIWLIRTADIRGEEHEYIGHVTLLR